MTIVHTSYSSTSGSDKRYWENKRASIHQREKELEKQITSYESDLDRIREQRREILAKAKKEAEELLRESNRKIENAIREIKEAQAEKEETKRVREELAQFKQEVQGIDTLADDDAYYATPGGECGGDRSGNRP